MTPTSEETRERARIFLEGLRESFTSKLPANEVKQKMQEYERGAKRINPTLVQRETYFSNTFVVPAIHSYLCKFACTQAPSDACRAFLAEGYVNFKEIASGSPMSAFKHPFKKQFNAVSNIAKSWWSSSKESPLCNACPDFALSSPCPYKVVGETKYFWKGGIEAAKTELVRGIYQCFYYRGLPWDYEYACLLAYDASDNGSLTEAWRTVDPRVKAACWNSANIFVMVLPSA